MQLSVNTRAKCKSYVRKIKFITETLLTSFFTSTPSHIVPFVNHGMNSFARKHDYI